MSAGADRSFDETQNHDSVILSDAVFFLIVFKHTNLWS